MTDGEKFNLVFKKMAYYKLFRIQMYVQKLEFWFRSVNTDELGREIYIFLEILRKYGKVQIFGNDSKK
jgi:hypothetical protein